MVDTTGTIRYEGKTPNTQLTDFGNIIEYDVYNSEEWFMSDAQGNIILEPEWSYICQISETDAIVGKGIGDGKKYGVIDLTTNQMKMNPSFDNIALKSENGRRTICQLGYYIYIDDEFNTVIAPQYISGEDFSEGYAMVKMNDGWHIIDLEGQIVY